MLPTREASRAARAGGWQQMGLALFKVWSLCRDVSNVLEVDAVLNRAPQHTHKQKAEKGPFLSHNREMAAGTLCTKQSQHQQLDPFPVQQPVLSARFKQDGGWLTFFPDCPCILSFFFYFPGQRSKEKGRKTPSICRGKKSIRDKLINW